MNPILLRYGAFLLAAVIAGAGGGYLVVNNKASSPPAATQSGTVPAVPAQPFPGQGIPAIPAIPAIPPLVKNKPPVKALRASYEIIPLNPAEPTQNITVRISDTTKNNKLAEVFRYKITADPNNDANIYIWASVPFLNTLNSQPVDCSNIFLGPILVADARSTDYSLSAWYRDPLYYDSSGYWSQGIGPLESNKIDGWCYSIGGDTPITFAPGESKTISLRFAPKLTAPAGLQFRLTSANRISSSPYWGYGGDRDVLIANSSGTDWLNGGGSDTNYIVIAP